MPDSEEYNKIGDFVNLYKAHLIAKRGKGDVTEIIQFDLNLSSRLVGLSESIRNKTYKISGYYSFYVYEPKVRKIHALHYADRVVQHSLCDNVIAPALEKRLIYDNAACRKGKGVLFLMKRLTGFMHDFYRKNGTGGYFLRCDIRKYFDSIDHDALKKCLLKVGFPEDVKEFLYNIIDSYETSPGKGLPLGNQTSQWFALYYLDGLDRLVKEKLHIKYYVRYMDDCVIIHEDREYLKECLKRMREYIRETLCLEFNEKTQIFPLRNGVDFLGFHYYLTENGKVIRKVKQEVKKRFRRRVRGMVRDYGLKLRTFDEIHQVVSSYRAHLDLGHTRKLKCKILGKLVLIDNPEIPDNKRKRRKRKKIQKTAEQSP